mmetsp:Transcript_34650/g.69312  ORF Transcript_34650/g.69312 Transcript_34650/m.69312 type:complete len:356 (-) Transcript_34650:89-1156(-)
MSDAIETGEQRRKKFPNRGLIEGAPPSPLVDLSEGWESKFILEHGLHQAQTGSGISLYWESIAPVDPSKIERVMVFIHGLADNVGFCTGTTMIAHAQHHNVAVIGMDLPGHGRSDGLHMYINDWHEFVDEGIDFIKHFVKPKVEEWSKTSGRALQLYGHGESLGGGLLTTLCIKEPQLLDGVVLIAPMVVIAPEMLPPPPVLWLFEHVVSRLLPTAKIAPNKDIGAVAWSDPAQRAIVSDNALGMHGDQLRVRSAHSMVAACRWMEERLGLVRTPLLIVHAANDKVTDSAISQRLYAEAATAEEDKRINLIDNDWHADLVSGGPSQRELMASVLRGVIDWLQLRDTRAAAQAQAT